MCYIVTVNMNLDIEEKELKDIKESLEEMK